MQTTSNTVRYDVREDVAFLTLDAPPVNVLSGAMMVELANGIERAQADRSLKALVLQSVGRAFSAGADVGEHRPEDLCHHRHAGHQLQRDELRPWAPLREGGVVAVGDQHLRMVPRPGQHAENLGMQQGPIEHRCISSRQATRCRRRLAIVRPAASDGVGHGNTSADSQPS